MHYSHSHTCLQIATQLADLHDTPARMLHKKTVRAVIRWRESRHYLYWRLRRRLDEEFTRKQLALSATHVPLAMVRSTLEDLAKESNTVIVDDRSFCGWFTSTGRSMVESRAAAARRESLRDEVIELLRRKGMDMDELRAAMAEIHEE